jgi:hypothetical protein
MALQRVNTRSLQVPKFLFNSQGFVGEHGL